MKLVLVLSMLFLVEGQNTCVLEYTSQPKSQLSCNPFMNNDSPPRLDLELECEIMRNEGNLNFTIEWFKNSSTGNVTRLGAVGSIRLTDNPFTMESKYDVDLGMSESSPFPVELWCQAVSPGHNTIISNVLTLESPQSYNSLQHCSQDLQRVRKNSCALQASPVTPVPTTEASIATIRPTNSLIANVTMATTPSTTTSVNGVTNAGAELLIKVGIITTAVVVVALVTIISITTIVTVFLCSRTKSRKNTPNTSNVYTNKSAGNTLSMTPDISRHTTAPIAVSSSLNSDPPYSNPHYFEVSQNYASPSEPQYCNPHYFSPSQGTDYQQIRRETLDKKAVYTLPTGHSPITAQHTNTHRTLPPTPHPKPHPR